MVSADTPSARDGRSPGGFPEPMTRNLSLEEGRRTSMRSVGLLTCSMLAAVLSLVSTHGMAADGKFTIGVSNTLIGNGWREEMVCSVKAEALASGVVSKLVLANRNGGPSEQIADLRNLISAGVNAIIVNPSDRKALNSVIKQATSRGI